MLIVDHITTFLDGEGRGVAVVPKKSETIRVKGGIVVSKFCSKHGEFLPISEFWFNKNGKGKGTYPSYCIECFSDFQKSNKRREYVETRRDKDGVLQYRCSKCREFKYIVDFVKDPSRKSGRSYNCRACKKEYSVNYYKIYYPRKKKKNGKAI